MIESYRVEKMEDDIQYIKKIKDMSRNLSFEEYLKNSLTFFPGHKWFIGLDNANIQAFQMAFVFLKFNQPRLTNIISFDELIKYIDDFDIDRFGELSIYDTALAVGISKDIMPDKVFLHAGPREAMKYILGNKFHGTVKYLKKGNRIQYVDLNDMPTEFNIFRDKPYLIEDCLCYIYSHFIKIKKL